MRLSLCTACLLLAAGTGSAAESDDPATAKLRADCRIEGTAVGLEGEDLKQFVAQCVTDLLEITYGNTKPH